MSRHSEAGFLRDSGAIGPLVFQKELGTETSTFTLPKPFALIGHDPGSDIVLDRKNSSGRFAYVQVIAGRVLCVDLQRYGELPGKKRRRLGWLSPGQSFNAGAARIRLVSGLPATASLQHLTDLPVITISGPTTESRSFCQPLTLLGAAGDCQMRFDSPHVSRFHAAVVAVPNRIWVVSLLAPSRRTGNSGAFAIERGGQARLRLGDIDLQLRVSPASNSLATISRTTSDIMVQAYGADPVATLARHFMATQNEMFAQFQETISTFMNTVGAMHNDLAQLLHREMERVDRLDRELVQLRAEQARLGLGVGTAVPDTPTTPAHQLPPVVREKGPTHPYAPLITPEVSADSDSISINVHAWLSQRVSELQQERQGVWSRIRSYLNGMNSPTQDKSTGSTSKKSDSR